MSDECVNLCVIIYIIGSLIIVPLASLQIKEYYVINQFHHGMVYFNANTSFYIQNFDHPHVTVDVQGYISSDSTNIESYKIRYPPDRFNIITTSAHDVTTWVSQMKTIGYTSAYLSKNDDIYSYTENLDIRGWIAALILFSIPYLFLGAFILVNCYKLCCIMKRKLVTKYNAIQPSNRPISYTVNASALSVL